MEREAEETRQRCRGIMELEEHDSLELVKPVRTLLHVRYTPGRQT